jgi:hypothetical protein
MSLLSITKRTIDISGYASSFPNIVPTISTGGTTISADIFVVDNFGNIYFAASGGSAIYKTTIAGGTPVVFAGSASVTGNTGAKTPYTDIRFTNLLDIAIDGGRNLYVIDNNSIMYLTTSGTPTAGTIQLNTSGTIRKIAVNTTGTRICMIDVGNNALIYVTCTSAPYGGTTNNGAIPLGTNGRPTAADITGMTFLPDGSSGLFFIVLQSGAKLYISAGVQLAANTVYSVTNLDSFPAPPTLTAYTVNGSNNSPSTYYFQDLLFTSSTAGYAVVLNTPARGGSILEYYIVINVNTSSHTITTTLSPPTLLGNGLLNTTHYKPGFYSDALNTAVFLSPSTSQGLFAFQSQY